jgi:hypothetical protein
MGKLVGKACGMHGNIINAYSILNLEGNRLLVRPRKIILKSTFTSSVRWFVLDSLGDGIQRSTVMMLRVVCWQCTASLSD